MTVRWILASSATLFISASILIYFHDKFWWPPDDGAYAYVAARISAGDVLNRDIQDIHMGYVNFLNALAFKLFGLQLVSIRISGGVPRHCLREFPDPDLSVLHSRPIADRLDMDACREIHGASSNRRRVRIVGIGGGIVFSRRPAFIPRPDRNAQRRANRSDAGRWIEPSRPVGRSKRHQTLSPIS